MQILSKTLAAALLLGLPLAASAQPAARDAGCPPGTHRAESEAVPGSGGIRQAESETVPGSGGIRQAQSEAVAGGSGTRKAESEAVPGSGGVRQAESEASASRLASLAPCK